MAINGIGSYGSYYSYQASINNMRLAQALAKNPRYSQSAVSSNSALDSSLKSSVNFVKEYNSSMSDLMKASNELRSVNSSGAMTQLGVTSSDADVATATARYGIRNKSEMTLDVAQLAQSQTNVSDGIKSAQMATSDMDFTIGSGSNSVNVKVTAANGDGTTKTNVQMLKAAAQQINDSNVGVRATVTQKDGVATLSLAGKNTGASNSFTVSGEMGAAAGAENVQNEAMNAQYSVTTNGKTVNYSSESNNVSMDLGRISVNLKNTGETTIRADVDNDKIVSAVGDMVKAYNSSLKLLNDNYDRGTGVDRQLRNMLSNLGSEQSMAKLGITTKKDGTLELDSSVLRKNLEKEPSLTKQLLSGTGGLANTLYNKASSGIGIQSGSLIDGDLSASTQQYSSFNMFSAYSKSGVYSLNNYAAVGMMMNYLI